MIDLRPDTVRQALEGMGYVVADEDLPEVTYRINAINQAITTLDDPMLDAIEPVPIFWLSDHAHL